MKDMQLHELLSTKRSRRNRAGSNESDHGSSMGSRSRKSRGAMGTGPQETWPVGGAGPVDGIRPSTGPWTSPSDAHTFHRPDGDGNCSEKSDDVGEPTLFSAFPVSVSHAL